MLAKFLETFYLLFLVIDPLGVIPIFLGITEKYSVPKRNLVARKAVLIASGLLFCFAGLGDSILHILNISEPAFRIAGGILLLLIAIDMVMAHNLGFQGDLNVDPTNNTDYGVAVFPLAIPLIAGPGALISIVLNMRQAKESLELSCVVLLALLCVLILTYVCLRYAQGLINFIGKTGANIITRVFGIILAALGVQSILTAINQLMIKPLFCI